MTKPRVSLAFPCYQQQAYVQAALSSVLAQTYSPLQIVISDDASTDGTYDIVVEETSKYRGPHSIKVHRNTSRMGIENYNRLMEMAEGDFVVMAHSDDIALPHRTQRLVEAWQRHGVSLVSSNSQLIDKAGKPLRLYLDPKDTEAIDLQWMITTGSSPKLVGSALAWDREVFDRFGPLNHARSAICTDWILPFRATLLRGVHYICEPLMMLRIHDESRAYKFLFNTGDQTAISESDMANRTTQFVYMLETLQAFERENHDSRWKAVRAQLVRSIMQSTINWTTTRNQLMAQGRIYKWSQP